MYVITNRAIKDGTGLQVFGDTPNEKGPNELRLVEVTASGKDFTVTALKDRLSPAEVSALVEKHALEIDPEGDWFASLKVACAVFERAQKESRHILVFVHGYNNDMQDVLTAAKLLEQQYALVVVPFSWPAKGGGFDGTANYLDDKDHARISDTALNRTIKMIHYYHELLTRGSEKKARVAAIQKHPDNGEKARQLYTKLIEKDCKMTLNLLCHSMGNYVLKHAVSPDSSGLRELVFDNVNLVAADVNNEDHVGWVRNIPVRNRLSIVINENDGALKWSRRKPGDAQKERLGHYLKNLASPNAYYLDVTHSKGVGSEHSYFKGKVVDDNATLKRVFARLFEGGRAEESMKFHADLNLYRTS